MRTKRVAVDWDATCVEEVWPGNAGGDWLPGAVEALRYLASVYEEVVIYTLRVSPVDLDEVTPRSPFDQIVAIGNRLDEVGLPANITVWTKPYKPPCVSIIDDKVIRFEGDWNAALEKLAEIDPTNHRKENGVATNSEVPKSVPADGDWILDIEPEHRARALAEGYGGVEILCAPSVFLEEPKTPVDPSAVMREFETGATRNNDVDAFDYEGFLSPLALWAFGAYMHKNRFQANGTIRDSDNWQKGIPQDSYRKSLVRHVMDLWLVERGFSHLAREDKVDALCAIIFNAQGLLHETLKEDL